MVGNMTPKPLAEEVAPLIAIGKLAWTTGSQSGKQNGEGGGGGEADHPLPNIVYIAPSCIVWLYSEHYKVLLRVFLH